MNNKYGSSLKTTGIIHSNFLNINAIRFVKDFNINEFRNVFNFLRFS